MFTLLYVHGTMCQIHVTLHSKIHTFIPLLHTLFWITSNFLQPKVAWKTGKLTNLSGKATNYCTSFKRLNMQTY